MAENNTTTDTTIAAMVAELARLKSENASLQAAKAAPRKLSLKVGQKGGIVISGTGRYPVTFYRSQAEHFFAGCTGGVADQVRAFIAAHPELAVKGQGE